MDRNSLVNRTAAAIYTDPNGNRDLSAIYCDYDLMGQIVAKLADHFRGQVDYVAAPEAIGFVLGGMLARELGVGFVPIRNGGIPYMEGGDMIRASYIDHRDCARSLTLHKSAFLKGSRVLLADDWIKTAATMQACVTLMEMTESRLVGIAAIGRSNPALTRTTDGAPIVTIIA